MERQIINSKVSRNPNIVSGIIDSETVAANIDSGAYHRLNLTGSRIWELLEEPKTVEELCSLVAVEFRVTPEECAGAVFRFVEALASRGMVALS